jgi:predicted MFS family arabinose efflux permease
MLICLGGALVGYLITIAALMGGSLWLLILGRAITGFTAGNQPIAQAAMVDLSRDDAEKTRNMGYIVTGVSLGLVAGPIIGGTFSDATLLGDAASLRLPFYVATLMILLAIVLIALFFEDARAERAPLRIRPLEIFLLLWRITRQPTVLRIAMVYFWFMFVSNTFFVFMDNYLSSRFGVGTTGASAAMLVFGVSIALSSALLVGVLGARFSKQAIIAGAAVVEILAIGLFILTPSMILTYLAIVPFGVAFAVGYPTLLSVFSAGVDDTEQGWVMGVSTALFTLGAGLTSLIGGDLMGLDIDDPFLVAIGAAMMALVLIATVWRSPDIRRLVRWQIS